MAETMKTEVEDCVLLALVLDNRVELTWQPGFNTDKPLGVIGPMPAHPVHVWAFQCYDARPHGSRHDRNNRGWTARVQVRVRGDSQQLKDAHTALTETLLVEHKPLNGYRLTGSEESFADLGPDADGNPEMSINYQFLIA